MSKAVDVLDDWNVSVYVTLRVLAGYAQSSSHAVVAALNGDRKIDPTRGLSQAHRCKFG